MVSVLLRALLLSSLPGTTCYPGPCLEDLQRFPPHAVCRANVELADAHLAWLTERARAWPSETNLEWWREALWLRNLWWQLWLAQCADHPVEVRLSRLNEVFDRLGRHDYFHARLPPPVPLWRFRRF